MNRFVPFAAVLITALGTLPAQGRDPIEEIQEIARRVEEQLREIDKLLLESGQKSQTRTQQHETLKRASERSEAVDGGIEELIEKLTEMKNQRGSGQPQDQQDQKDQQQGQSQPQGGDPRNGQPQGAPQARRENQTPDFVQQPKTGGQQQQPGQGQEKPVPQGRPQSGQETRDGGENRPPNQQQPEPELGPGQPGTGDETWGDLQPYLNRIKNRGSTPRVPEKYRKYWQAYLKSRQAGESK